MSGGLRYHNDEWLLETSHHAAEDFQKTHVCLFDPLQIVPKLIFSFCRCLLNQYQTLFKSPNYIYKSFSIFCRVIVSSYKIPILVKATHIRILFPLVYRTLSKELISTLFVLNIPIAIHHLNYLFCDVLTRYQNRMS